MCLYFTVQNQRAQLKELNDYVREDYAVAWREIGKRLGVPEGRLNTLQKDYPNDNDYCFGEIFTEWLSIDPKALWSTMLEALDSPEVNAAKREYSRSISMFQYTELEMVDAVSVVAKRLQETSEDTRYKVSADDWPNIELTHFTSIALIHYKKGQNKKEEIEVIADYQCRGMPGDVNLTKTTKDISEIFAPMETDVFPKTVLIEGAPGIGKTTLSKEIVYQWSKMNLLNHKRLVILVFLRDPIAQGIRTLKEFISTYCGFTPKSNAIIEESIKNTRGKDITVVLDGYDELPEDIRSSSESFFIKLIHQKVPNMLKSMVVITSRLTVSVELHNMIERRVEILGFTEDNRKEYIRQALKENSEGAEKLLAYLKRHPAINAYCYIPLNMTILLCLFNEGGENAELPTTQTEINKSFICITISRYIIRIREERHGGISDFSTIPARYKDIFLELCHLAFQALCDNKIVFTKSEYQNICKRLTLDSEKWNGLGLLKAVEFLNMKDNIKNTSFNFLHLSLQETLAAHYITLLSEKVQIKLLKENFLNFRYFNTWIMYVGLTKGQSFAFKHFLSGNRLKIFTSFSLWFSKNPGISRNLIANKVICLHLFQCFSEAENEEMCQYVGQLLQDQKIDLSGQTLNPVNIHTLGLFLGRSTTKHWKFLSLANCYLGDTEIERLYAFSSSSRTVVCIDKLDLSYNNLSPSSSALLADLFSAWNIGRVVMYSGNAERKKIDNDTVNNVIDQMSKIDLTPNQIEIFITNKSILVMCMQQYEAIVAALSSKNFYSIHLFSCSFGSTFNRIAQVALMLADRSMKCCLHSCDVPLLDIVESVMKSKMLSFHYAKENSTVFNQNLNAINQQVEFAIKLGDNVLPLHMYNVTDKTLRVVKKDVLQGDTQGMFVFRNCESKDIQDIVTCFSSLPNWQYFILNTRLVVEKCVFNQIIPILMQKAISQFMLNTCWSLNQAADGIADIFRNSTSLQQLSLCNCKLQNQNILLICEAVCTINTLVHINLSGNTISNQAAVALAKGISTNVHLQNLELAKCNLYDEGLGLICHAISTRKMLTVNLNCNCITDKVAESLAHAITSINCVKNLYLKRCSMKYKGIQLLIAAFGQLKCLNVLDLSYNKMSQPDLDISSVAIANQCLQDLNLSFCDLQEDTMASIVKALNGEELKFLNLSGNHISDMVARCMVVLLANSVELQQLYLSRCDLQENALNLLMRNTQCTIQHLDISYNIVSDASAKHVADMISKNTKLTHLDLSNCNMKERGLGLIVKAINKSVMLQYVDLKSSQVNVSIAGELAAFISDNHRLDHLCLSDCAIKEEELLRIAEAFKQTKFLQHLDISSNSITDKVASKLVSTDLLFDVSQLKQLNFSNCQWQTKGLTKILIAATNMYNLKCVDYSECKMSDEEARLLAGSITTNDTLKHLVLSKCNLKPAGLLGILGVLKNLNTLIHLDLSHNQLSENAATTLTEVISANNFEHLNLSHCLQEVNRSNLLTAIVNSVTLQYLDLSYNDISDDAASCVAAAITANKCLSYLNLSNNQYGCHSIKMILNAMATINSLQLIDLSSYSISDELAIDLEEVASCNGGLENIFLYSYAIYNVKLEQVPISTSKLVLTMLCINDQTVNESEACAVASLIGSSSSICHLDLANSMIPDTKKPMIVKAMKKHTSLTHLNLSGISVTADVEDDLSSLVADSANLRHLALADCELKDPLLKKLPEVLEAHEELFHLNLSYNTISPTAAVSIAKVVTKNTQLQGIKMADCELTETSLVSIFKALNKLKRIENLDLSGNVLSENAVKMMSTLVTNNPNLKQIKLAGCKLNSDGIIKLVEGMNSCRLTGLTDLNLSGSIIVGQALDRLFSVIASCRKLQHLELSGCGIADLKVFHFRTLHMVTTLRHLDLSDNPISDVYANDLANFIAKNTQLRNLNVSNCSLATEGVLKLIKVLKESTVVQHLDLGLNYLTDQLDNVAAEIAVLISKNNAIEHLCLPYGVLLDNDLQVVLKAMQETNSLKYIDISCNQISSSLYQHVTDLIASNKNLDFFKISKLVLSQGGLDQLVDALPKLRGLQMVSLNECHVSDRQRSQLSVMISQNPGITDFRVTDCVLSDLVIDELFTSLKVVKLLSCLVLHGIVFTDSSIEQVVAVIAVSQNVEHLSFADCRMSESGKAKIFKALTAITTLQHLNINHITVDSQVENDMALLVANSIKLNSLELVGSNLTESGIKKLGNALATHESLFCIKLNNNTLKLTHSKLLSVIAKNTNLVQLEMANCNLKEADIVALTETIRCGQLKSLSCINLSGNKLTATATRTLFLMLYSHPSFKHLELHNCDMIIAGIKLQETLNLALSLSYLDVSHNPIGKHGAELLAAFILNNNKIKLINLSNCKFQSHEINLLFTALKNVTSLQFVDLSMNDSRDGTLAPIGPVISNNHFLTFLHLPIYNFSKQDLVDIFEGLVNILSSIQGTQMRGCFVSVARYADFMVQRLKIFEVGYDEYATGKLNNMQDILECFENPNSSIKPCPPYGLISNCLIIEAGLFNTFKAMANACSLEHLHISNTPVTNFEHLLATAIGSNKALLHLELAACRLKDTAIVKLAQAFGNLKNLVHLNLSQNDCRVMHLSSAISGCTELEYLDVSSCNITGLELVDNKPLNNKKLKHFNISSNPITDTAAAQVVTMIKNNPMLQHLNLCDCEFQPDGMKEIVLVLKSCTSLKHLNLMSNTASDELADEVAVIIDNNSDLSHVYLPNNVLHHKCIEDAFKRKVSLKKVNSRTNQVATVKLENLGMQIETIFNDLACKSLSSGVKFLAVNFNFVSKQALKLLIGFLNNNSSIEHLEISVSGLTEAYIRGLCNALHSFESLKYLSVCCSDVTVEAASSLADVLNVNKKLQHLILHNCTLNSATLQKLGDALKNVSNLKSIDLSFNDFSYEAVSKIDDLISKNLLVEHLDLSNCRLKKAEISIILSRLTEISGLKFLNLGSNEMPDDISDAVAAVTSTNPNLTPQNVKL